MELRSLLRLLRGRWLPILVTVLVGATIGYGLSPREPLYQSTATVYVGASSFEIGDASLSGDQNLAIGLVAQTFARLLESEQLAGDALDLVELDRSAEDVVAATDAEVEVGTTLIRITVADEDPSTSQALSNALADAFIDQVQTLEPPGTTEEGQLPTLPAQIFERASLPTEPLPTGTLRNVALGVVLGLLVSVGLVLLVDYLDVTARGPDEVERTLELPVLGMVPSSRELAAPRTGSPGG